MGTVWTNQALQFNLAGVAPSEIGGRGKPIPTGPVTFDITSAELDKTQEGNLKAVFKCSVIAPPEAAGAERTVSVRLPHVADQSQSALNARPIWRAWCEAAGFTAAQLDAGVVQITGASFAGKRVNGFYEQKLETKEYPAGSGKMQEFDNGDLRGLSPASYAKLVQATGAVQQQTTQTQVVTQPAVQVGTQSVVQTQPVTQAVQPAVNADVNAMLAQLGIT